MEDSKEESLLGVKGSTEEPVGRKIGPARWNQAINSSLSAK